MIGFGIITVSDGVYAKKREDLSGPALKNLLEENGWETVQTSVIPDEEAIISETLFSYSQVPGLDIILTTGGTGFTKRDVTPEATKKVIEKEAISLAQIMLLETYRINPKSVLSRGTAGILNQKLIINLPGSPKGAVENLKVIMSLLPHAVDLLRGESTTHQV
jgi:molybdenum cofactor synthesis domain-containing protein